MTFSCVSPDEVRAKYAGAKDKEYMLRVLADLTASTKAEVRAFLGVTAEKKVMKEPVALDEAAARQLYNQGMSDNRIATRLGVTAGTVCRWRHLNDLPSVPSVSKVTDNRMELYQAGLTDREIGDRVGVHQGSIYDWRKRNGLPPNGTRGGDRWSKKKQEVAPK